MIGGASLIIVGLVERVDNIDFDDDGIEQILRFSSSIIVGCCCSGISD